MLESAFLTLCKHACFQSEVCRFFQDWSSPKNLPPPDKKRVHNGNNQLDDTFPMPDCAYLWIDSYYLSYVQSNKLHFRASNYNLRGQIHPLWSFNLTSPLGTKSFGVFWSHHSVVVNLELPIYASIFAVADRKLLWAKPLFWCSGKRCHGPTWMAPDSDLLNWFDAIACLLLTSSWQLMLLYLL